MYLDNSGYVYYDGTEQRHSRANFLILVQDKDQNVGPDNFRAIVRKVALRQCGQFMMGTARIKNQSITVSGAYGSDGLPVNVNKEIFEMGIPVPKELYELWNKGGGWNSTGTEALTMSGWAHETFEI
jgi:hypothetical protein